MDNIIRGMSIEEINKIFDEIKEGVSRKWIEHSSVGIEAYAFANFSILIDERKDAGIAVCVSEKNDEYEFDESTGKMKMTLFYCIGEIKDYSTALLSGSFKNMFHPDYCTNAFWSKEFVLSGQEESYIYDGAQAYGELYDVLNNMRIGNDDLLKP